MLLAGVGFVRVISATRAASRLKPSDVAVDLVLRMAPNMSGVDTVDQPRSMYLAELADFATNLRAAARSSSSCSGRGLRRLHPGLAQALSAVKVKPEASRSRSSGVPRWQPTNEAGTGLETGMNDLTKNLVLWVVIAVV